MNSWRKVDGVCLALSSVLAGLCGLASLTWPFGWDQGVLSSVGDTILRGGMPYRDAWDIKGPLSYYVFALAQWAFGKEMWSIRVLDILVLALAALVIGRITSKYTNRSSGLWASVLLVLWYLSGNYWHTAQPDGWAGFLLLFGVAPLLSSSERLSIRTLVFSSACLGACLLVKQVYVVFALLPAIRLWSQAHS